MRNFAGKVSIAIFIAFGASGQALADITWSGNTGNWSDSSQWVGGVIPGATDHAVINAGFVTILSNTVVDSLTLNNGQINGYGNITTNTFSWTQGNINIYDPESRTNGVLTVNGNATIGLNGSEISLAGNWNPSPYSCNDCPMSTLVLNGNTTLQGKLTAGIGGIINNGTLTLKEGSNTFIDYWNRWWSPLINNGTLDGNAGEGKTANIFNLFGNDGKVIVSSGTLVISNYYGSVVNKSGSLFQVKSGASVAIGGDGENGLINNGGEVVIENGATITASGLSQTSGTTIIRNANAYLGDAFSGIRIEGGELIAQGSLNAGVEIHDGARLSFGEHPAALNILGNLWLQKDSEVTFNISGLQRGIDYDALDASGFIFVSGILNVNFDNFEPVLGSKYLLFSGYILSNEYAEFVDGYVFSHVNVSGLDLNKYSYRLDYTDSGITFNVLAVPEPSAYAMLGLGLGLIGFAARRRKIN